MRPDDIINALRLAIASGAIVVKTYNGPYPATEIDMCQVGDTIHLYWTGATIQLMPQGSINEPLVPRNVSDRTSFEASDSSNAL